MLTYSFANLQGESMYAHLYKCIKNDITNGVLPCRGKAAFQAHAGQIRHQPHHRGNAYAQLVVEIHLFAAQARLTM